MGIKIIVLRKHPEPKASLFEEDCISLPDRFWKTIRYIAIVFCTIAVDLGHLHQS
jgi:hypothetical protein